MSDARGCNKTRRKRGVNCESEVDHYSEDV
jgi:hypothetical protein